MAKVITAPSPDARPPSPDGFAPQRAVGAASRGGKLPRFGDRTRMFFLGAHPTSWDLVETSDGWRLLPILKRLIVQPGVWVKTAPKGQMPDPSFMLSKNEQAGFVVLRDIETYLYEVDGDGGNKGFFLNWEKVRTYDDGAFEVVVDPDVEYAFRSHLVTSGRVQAPREGIIAVLRNRCRKSIQRASRTPHLAMAQEAKAKAESRLTGLESAVVALRVKAAA